MTEKPGSRGVREIRDPAEARLSDPMAQQEHAHSLTGSCAVFDASFAC